MNEGDPSQSGIMEMPYYPKGVPRSFLKQKGYQFPKTSRTMAWKNSRFHMPVPKTKMQELRDASPAEVEEPPPEVYSPSDVYDDNLTAESDVSSETGAPIDVNADDEESSKNVFDRLESPKSKIPKLDINLQLDHHIVDRKVIIETNKKYIKLDLREEIKCSENPIVKQYVDSWPWSKQITEKKSISRTYLMSLSQREQEQLSDMYDYVDTFVKVSVSGYPTSWNKEDVLDAIIECVRGKMFIPCFVALYREECNFLVLDCKQALTALQNYGFNIRKDKVDLDMKISLTNITLKQLNFVPKQILKKIIASGCDNDKKLSLKAFTLNKDLSHFVYFPLNRISNQSQVITIASNISWEYIVELDLSHNRLSSIAGFDLSESTPRLKYLDLSHNLFEKLSALVCCRELLLESIILEGNPVCNDYTDPTHYVEVIKTLFPKIKMIDGVEIPAKEQMPAFKRNSCPEDAKSVAEVVLEVYFPLVEMARDERLRIEHLYQNDAVMTVTCRPKLRFAHMYRSLQDMLLRARSFVDGKVDTIEGAATIAKHINKWPDLQYDPTSFTVDVLHHSNSITVLQVNGLVKLIAASLADDEYILAFTKTFVLKSNDGYEYKITNHMVYWDEPTKEFANSGFKFTTINKKNLSLKLDTPPNEELKQKFIGIFMKLTHVNRKMSEKCLASKNWHFKNALEYFATLLKLDALNNLQ